MGFDYNYFTKAELVSFLNEYGKDFRYIREPYSVIIKDKQNNIFNELQKLGNVNDGLILKLKASTDVKEQLKIHQQLAINHMKWEKLHKKLDELNDKLIDNYKEVIK